MKLIQKINPNISSLKPYQPGKPIEILAKELGFDYNSIIKMASNESALGVSPKALESIKISACESFLYPDASAFLLRKRIADIFKLNIDNIIIGNGSNEILEFIGHCFMGEGKSVLMSKHAFVIYKLIAKMFASTLKEVDDKVPFTHDLSQILKAIDKDTSVVFICNPNNPTGTMLAEDEIATFMNHVPDDVLVVFDEAYAEICLEKMPNTLQYLENKNCIILRTFSKAYGLAGLRIGYGLSSKMIINNLQKARQPFNTSRIAQSAALAALDDSDFIEKSKNIYLEGKLFIESECAKLGLDYISTVTNFIMIKTSNGIEIFNKLQKKGIIVRPLSAYKLDEWIRVTISTAQNNKKFIQAIKEIL